MGPMDGQKGFDKGMMKKSECFACDLCDDLLFSVVGCNAVY
jgi:hypothetical protein